MIQTFLEARRQKKSGQSIPISGKSEVCKEQALTDNGLSSTCDDGIFLSAYRGEEVEA